MGECPRVKTGAHANPRRCCSRDSSYWRAFTGGPGGRAARQNCISVAADLGKYETGDEFPSGCGPAHRGVSRNMRTSCRSINGRARARASSLVGYPYLSRALPARISLTDLHFTSQVHCATCIEALSANATAEGPKE